MAPTVRALVFKKVPTDFPEVGEHLTVEDVPFDVSAPPPQDGIVVQVLYSSLDPYMRGRMRPPEVESYSPAFKTGEPIPARSIVKVLQSSNSQFKEGDLVTGFFPVQEYANAPGDLFQARTIKPLSNPFDIEDIRVFIGALGMPGLTAYSSLYEIGKPKRGETIFVSSASGAVGQIVGQLAKHEGLKVIGSVGSDDKLNYILNDLGFDGGFNYKKEKPSDALKRLAPQGIDIYYENVGGEQLEAALDALNPFGRIVTCGMISQYNLPPEKQYPIKNLTHLFRKRLEMRGFIVSDPDMGPKWAEQHQRNLGQWIKDGSFKVLMDETAGIEHAAEALVGIFHGKNFGKAILRIQKVGLSPSPSKVYGNRVR
ncbi:hypothetical protein Plec18167_006240 [Paecilomyces lecythidis]|uniref:Enoyl reductase (ER) domain-containing protein n=1 Tax=Paecilomyces lecythidis TaxID=3004212 RepID=A0ABR3XCN7_9EURO